MAMAILEVLQVLVRARSTFVLVVESERLVGLFTERDVVRAIATPVALAERTIAEVMTAPVITLTPAQAADVCTALHYFQRYQVCHLPVVNDQGQVVNVITPSSIRQSLPPTDWQRRCPVGAVMRSPAIAASLNATVVQLAQQMTRHHVGCVVILDPQSATPRAPVGIVTEWDLVQQRVQHADLSGLTAAAVMSSPAWHTDAESSLEDVHQLMQERRVQRLVVVNRAGELAGIVTQTTLLNGLAPLALGALIQTLQQRVDRQTAALEAERCQRQLVTLELQQLQTHQPQTHQPQTHQPQTHQSAVLNRAIAAMAMANFHRGHDAPGDRGDHRESEWICDYCSPGVAAIVGYSADELLADPQLWMARVHPDDYPLVALPQIFERITIAASSPLARPPLAGLTEEYRFYHKDGRLRWLAATYAAERDRQTQHWNITVVWSDITTRKQSEDQLRLRIRREQAINKAIQAIRSSLDLATIGNTTSGEMARLLQADRASIFQYLPQSQTWKIVGDHAPEHLPAVLGMTLADADHPLAPRLRQMEIIGVSPESPVAAGMRSRLGTAFPGDWLVIPIYIGVRVWGCLHLARQAPHPWQDREQETACRIVVQLAIAIQHAEACDQAHRLNIHLERQVQARTAQLELAHQFEATLKSITDKVRDSLDETQILQGAVEALAEGLKVGSCNATLFDLAQRVSTIEFEATTTLPPSRGRVFQMDHFPEIYSQLLAGQGFQFCSLLPNPTRGRVAMLACPIMDDREVLGSLWLINHSFYGFGEQDMRLVQQVATQCAIALRQSRLYQASQSQIEQLKRLDRLKDDFLSTISHELRTPMASIQLATEMLEAALQRQTHGFGSVVNALQPYVQILREQGDREIALINNLLELTRIDAEAHQLTVSAIDLPSWLPHVTAAFGDRLRLQRQHLNLDLPTDLPILYSDLSYLERILSELLHNACKYTPAAERICITAQVATTALHQPGIAITVSNSGVEIPVAERDRIFERFYRIPNNDPWKYGGTGLGLALVQKQLEQLQGQISVQSEAGWTRFTIHLPLVLAIS